jgi:hypothetical protein
MHLLRASSHFKHQTLHQWLLQKVRKLVSKLELRMHHHLLKDFNTGELRKDLLTQVVVEVVLALRTVLLVLVQVIAQG